MNTQEIDLDLISTAFDKQWINSISNFYEDYIGNNKTEIKNFAYFNKSGNYNSRNDNFVDSKISNHFNRLLFYPNICILDYVLKNYNDLKNFKFLDNGSGMGLLSIFLDKIGIKCNNYDNFDQVAENCFLETINDSMGLNISNVKNYIDRNEAIDVLTSSGIWVDNKEIFKNDLKYILMDCNWVEKSDFEKDKYENVSEYIGGIKILKKHGGQNE